MTQLLELQIRKPGAVDYSWRNPPILAMGFRPFFLMGALLAAAWVVLWVLVFSGVLSINGDYGGMIAWHSHEMVFGFAVAIIAGFLLTAVGNWTGVKMPHGKALGGLVLLWLAGRVVMFFAGSLPPLAPLLIDSAFLPALAISIAIPIIRTTNKRNFSFIALLGALSITNLLFHLNAGGWVESLPFDPVHIALSIIVVIMAIVGGRVIPFFTRNGLGNRDIDRIVALDRIAMALTVAWFLGEVIVSGTIVVGGLALLAGIVNLVRMKSWGSLKTFSVPLLWVLHLGYAWIGVGLILKGVYHTTGWIPMSAAIHALTVGAIGLLTIGMMARVALGHSGRPLKVGRLVTFCFGLVALAALIRVLAPLIAPDLYLSAVAVSGTLWAVAFLIYAILYWPILTRPRADGRPG